jgi:secreted trypsin-like serine protease
MIFRLSSIFSVIHILSVPILTIAGQHNTTNVTNDARSLQSRIVGGILAKAGDFPSFAIGSGCGATLIHSDILLTAAHCSGTFKGNTIRIAGIKRDGSR